LQKKNARKVAPCGRFSLMAKLYQQRNKISIQGIFLAATGPPPKLHSAAQDSEIDQFNNQFTQG
jgi:hypothetical protein